VARYLDALATFLREDIQVVTEPEPHARAFDEAAPYPVERRALFFRFFWPRWKKIVLLLWQRRASYRVVLVSHLLPLGAAAWVVHWFTRRPYVVFVHGMDVGLANKYRGKRWLAGRVLRAAALVVTNSCALEREVQQDFGVQRTEVVYPCVEVTRTDHAVHHDPNDPVTLLTVARLVPRKGHLRVLDAITYLFHMQQIGYRTLRYHIVGDGPMYETILEHARKLGVDSSVQIDRHVDDKNLGRVYRAADIFVMPTIPDEQDREGFGTVYLEAAAYGIPSIATRQAGVDEAVLDRKTGLLVPDGDIPALAGALQELIGDRGLRETLGQSARDRVAREFTCERQFRKLNTILDTL
jgi:phosphatidylinositol alpha-1,6-mannosyltransferase